MDMFLRGCSAVLIAVILILTTGKDRKEFATALSIGVCAMTALMATEYLRPVLDFIRQLKELGNLDSDMVKVLLKAVGIGMLCEIAVLICDDAGNGSLGKTLQYLGTAVILWLSLPLFTMLLELLQRILGEL